MYETKTKAAGMACVSSDNKTSSGISILNAFWLSNHFDACCDGRRGWHDKTERWVLFLKGWRISDPLPEQAWIKAKVQRSLLQSTSGEQKKWRHEDDGWPSGYEQSRQTGRAAQVAWRCDGLLQCFRLESHWGGQSVNDHVSARLCVKRMRGVGEIEPRREGGSALWATNETCNRW